MNTQIHGNIYLCGGAMAVTPRDNSSFRTVTPETHKEGQIHEDFLEDFVQEIVDAVGCTVEEAEESFLQSVSCFHHTGISSLISDLATRTMDI